MPTYIVTKVELQPALNNAFCGTIYFQGTEPGQGNDPDIVTNINRLFQGTDLAAALAVISSQATTPNPDA